MEKNYFQRMMEDSYKFYDEVFSNYTTIFNFWTKNDYMNQKLKSNDDMHFSIPNHQHIHHLKRANRYHQ